MPKLLVGGGSLQFLAVCCYPVIMKLLLKIPHSKLKTYREYLKVGVNIKIS